MKLNRAITTVALVTLLAGCTYKGPARTFEFQGFKCSHKGMEINIDPKVLEKITKSEGGGQGANLTPEDIKKYMEYCTKFLSGR